MLLSNVIKKLEAIGVKPTVGERSGYFNIGSLEFNFVVDGDEASHFGLGEDFMGHSVTSCINFAKNYGAL